jgi:hypothetical protein
MFLFNGIMFFILIIKLEGLEKDGKKERQYQAETTHQG